MKKTAMFGLLAMVLAFGFIGMGCPTEDDSGYGGNFKGQWVNTDISTLVFEFTSDKDVKVGNSDTRTKYGTFTVDEDDMVATIKWNSNGSALNYGGTASLNPDKDELTINVGSNPVTFEKKK